MFWDRIYLKSTMKMAIAKEALHEASHCVQLMSQGKQAHAKHREARRGKLIHARKKTRIVYFILDNFKQSILKSTWSNFRWCLNAMRNENLVKIMQTAWICTWKSKQRQANQSPSHRCQLNISTDAWSDSEIDEKEQKKDQLALAWIRIRAADASKEHHQ